MSVWVHSLSLVVPKQVLEQRYPGGCDALLVALSSFARHPRTYCDADERLVCMTFRDEGHLAPMRDHLVAAGLTECVDGDFIDFACVEPMHGPTAPCKWLMWRIDEDGRTIAWHASGEEGPCWIPSEANAFEESVPQHELRLACENGVETWLDFRTGALTWQVLDEGESSGGMPDATDGGDDDAVIDESPCDESVLDELRLDAGHGPALLRIVAATLRKQTRHVHRLTPTAFGFRARQSGASYDVIVTAQEETQVVAVYVTHPVHLPASCRAALAEAITRINWRLGVGSFDLDVDGGTLRYRTAVDVEGGALVPTMVHNMIGTSLYTMERFHAAFMRVAWGGMPAREAVAEVEGWEEG